MQKRVQFSPEYRKYYKNRFVDVVNGQLRSWARYENVERWRTSARPSMFLSGLKQSENDQHYGRCYNPTFDPNAMDERIMEKIVFPSFPIAILVCYGMCCVLGSP